jgi:serine/threonine protein kinase
VVDHFTVMEYVNGVTSEEKISTGQFSVEVIRYIVQLIKTIRYLPSKNIVHKDLTPQNVMRRN